jgi:hypothetical protein
MTKVFLIVSVACNVWFLSLLLYDRIMEAKLIRFFRHIAGLWRSLDCTAAEQGKDKDMPHADTSDIIGKSRFKMASTRTTAAIPAQEAATSEKGIELSEEEATFDDGNTETVSRPTQVPEDTTFSIISTFFIFRSGYYQNFINICNCLFHKTVQFNTQRLFNIYKNIKPRLI